MRYVIDLAGVSGRAALHERLRQALPLPEWYGNNLDALHDVLAEGGVTGELVFENAAAVPEDMRNYIAALRRMCGELPETVKVTWADGRAESPFLARAHELRAITERHYNCAQSVAVPFAAAAGLDEEVVYRLALNFGGGLKRAATCGAVVGGLMVLGMFGVEDPKTVAAFYKRVRDNHEGMLECADLLRVNKERGGERKPHCDGMVYECVALAEEMLREEGKL